jgi:hypothetical protein
MLPRAPLFKSRQPTTSAAYFPEEAVAIDKTIDIKSIVSMGGLEPPTACLQNPWDSQNEIHESI